MLSKLRSLFAAVHSEVHTCASNYCERYYCYCHYPEHCHNLFLSFNLLISLFEIFQKSSSESQNQVPNRPQTCLESIS